LGNAQGVDEYIRRQEMTAGDYRALLEKLARRFPAESFLIVRYGDHQPQFGASLIDRFLGKGEIVRRVEVSDPRYLTTYYAIDGVNFVPADVSSALDGLDAPYLPIVLLKAAGVPLDPTFLEQSTMLQLIHLAPASPNQRSVRRRNRRRSAQAPHGIVRSRPLTQSLTSRRAL